MGFKQDPNVPPLEREIRYFLYDLCVDWGFYIPPDAQDRIAVQESFSAHQFACDVVEADGMDPEIDSHFVKRIQRWFVSRFETDSVSVETFVDQSLKKAKVEW